jgi:CRP/FNR family transcriptional regulator
MKRNWPDIFPLLLDSPASRMDSEVSALLDDADEAQLPARSTVFRQGDQCSNYLLVIEGIVRVISRADNGREIVLYRLGPGDSCVLTTSCLFSQRRYPAEGVTESAVTALAIPASRFNRAIEQSAAFRRFVFATFGEHLGSLIGLVEQVAFGRLDARLARHLLEQAAADNTLQATHQELATELGSAREVISRQLKELEQRGMVSLQRGSLTVLDRPGLVRLAGG